ncbi:MAG: hypothetical protein KC593_25930 [Myxococcales bacterium]|nr:hypothetical protein [Myxococcales bacterium]
MATPPSASPRVRDLLDLPDQVRKGDFVLKLTEGVDDPEKTAGDFVATPPLVDAFDRALGLVGSALRDGKSQAAYLHGSFGSGKSHFMAVLSLMLSAHEAPWKKPELHPLREKHGFVGQRKLLQLRFHMIGKDSIESAIFKGYLDFVRQQHPEARVPAVFADEALFENAAAMLAELGEEAFFAPMNEGLAVDDGWGDIGAGSRWTAERFHDATRSAEPGVRAELFSALTKTRFTAYLQQSAFIDLDAGLGVLARHAAELGYDGMVLFLDELILWLAHRASEVSWMHNEVQKMVKLVEAQESHREIPIVSFIARQRNLADMVGEEYAGDESARLHESLEHWEGRFDSIKLEDRNLPAVVEKRVVRPKDAAARAQLDAAFETLRRGAGDSWDTMLSALDGAAFRQLYPFSPALVDALVALSNSLQRSRTAIRLLNELLVDHIDDLAVGEVVRVGDLFDVLAGGEDAADGVMKSRFESAKRLYEQDLLPVIRTTHQTGTPERCQRLRPDHRIAIGCSNCPERACRRDNRLLKTLLISALVPNVDVLKDLTVSRLVQLNHGSLKVPIPGTEASVATKLLQDWAAQVGQIQLGQQGDPRVNIRLEGVPLGPILEQARDKDSQGARQRVVRELLFSAMGMDASAESGVDQKVEWRGTKRVGHVRFGNVRKMSDAQLACDDAHDWRLVVDYPFDDAGFGPNDDLAKLDAYMEQGAGTWTLVWLPSFFAKPMNDLLGEVVVLEHILESRESKKKYLGSLSAEDRARAELDLENLYNAKRARLFQSLEQAYGLRADKDADLDSGRRVDEHLRVLKPGAKVRMSLAPNLAEALSSFVPALLERRYPRHPYLEGSLSARRLDLLVERFGHIVNADDKRIPADRALVGDMKGTLVELGLVRTTENAVHLVEDKTLQRLEQRRAQLGEDRPTVAQVRHFIDEGGQMGLPLEVQDLVVRCYARWSARTLVMGGRAFEPGKGPLPGDVELEKPELPSQTAWNQALGLAGAVFGITFAGKGLHGDNLKRLQTQLDARVSSLSGACEQVPELLGQRLAALGVSGEVPRMETAESARALLRLLSSKNAVLQVESLSGFTPKTSSKALAAHLVSAADVCALLQNQLVFGVFEQLREREGELRGAAELVEDVRKCLRQDELNERAAAKIRALAEQGQRLLNPPVLGTHVAHREPVQAKGKAAALRALREAVARLEAQMADLDDDGLELRGTLELRVPDES